MKSLHAIRFVFFGLIALIAGTGLYLTTPSLSAITLFDKQTNSARVVELPYRVTQRQGKVDHTYVMRGIVQHNGYADTRFVLTGDDCIISLKVNRQQVRHPRLDSAPRQDARRNCNHSKNGIEVNLRPYLKKGKNRIEAVLHNSRGGYAFNMQPLDDTIPNLFLFALALAGFGVAYQLFIMLSPATPAAHWSLVLFLGIIYVRFFVPFLDDPNHQLFSDTARHYFNGINFLKPTLMGSKDPFLYQLWVFLIYRLSGGEGLVMNIFTGALCATMPWLYYRFLREMLPRAWALAGAIIIGITPSFLTIYTFYMNETLLLNMIGLSLWMTARAWRKGTLKPFAIACTCWILTTLTKLIAAPLAAVALVFLTVTACRGLGKREAAKTLAMRGGVFGLLFGLLLIWPALHSYEQLRFYAPFGNDTQTKIYRRSGAQRIDFRFTNMQGQKLHFGFGSPALYARPPMSPLSEWKSRRDGSYHFEIDAKNGKADWQKVLDSLPYSMKDRWLDTKENLVFLLFGNSWPDASGKRPSRAVGWWARWMWPVLIGYLFVALVPYLRRPGDGIIARGTVLLAAFMVLMLLLQQTAIVEGRFRKPIEPLILCAAVVMSRRFFSRTE